jgi:hypothetical protein
MTAERLILGAGVVSDGGAGRPNSFESNDTMIPNCYVEFMMDSSLPV